MAEPFPKPQRASARHHAARGEARCAGIIGERLSRAAGVIIEGVDLSRPLSSALRDQILTALRDHHVVVFPDQSPTREQQFVFSASFGEIEHNGAAASAGKRHGVAHVISNLDAQGRPVDRSASPVSNYRWHTDKAYNAVPPLLTTLYAVELPAQGGNTEFASTVMGYLALPLETKRQIAGLRVVFRWGASGEGMSGSLLPETGRREHPPVDHPLVRTHPDTGAKALYLGNHSSHILGLPEHEGRALLDRLLDHTTQRQFVYAHRWRQGDLVMWDNRCLLHRAVADYRLGQDRRIMHRAVVRGSVPV
ncbi:MAG: TauD/TfdA dioxygenase family protein [Stellaceae bacterium]